MNKNKKNICLSIVLTITSIIYIFLVKNIDVKAIGPKNSSVGFSSINGFFKDLLGSNMTIYKITEVLGIFALLIVGIYGLVGIVQLIKRKSLFKVDKKIIVLGCLYAVVLGMYVLFEKVVINYRPVLIDKVLEASFPSSHTMLAVCVCMSAIIMNKDYIKNKKYLKYTNICIFILMLLIVLGRFISGVHWFSDIVGGLLISATLLSYFDIAYRRLN